MSRKNAYTAALLVALATLPGFGRVRVSKLAGDMLYGDPAARLAAIKTFNRLPADEQYEMTPDFMAALHEEDPEVRKIAERILKAMRPRVEPMKTPGTPVEKKKAAEEDKWADLKKMKKEEYAHPMNLKDELELEKKDQVHLEAKDLLSELKELPPAK